MTDLVGPDELPLWVPGDLTLDSAPLAWDGIRLRVFRYGPSDVRVPALRDHVIVAGRRGATPVDRRCDGPWRSEYVGPDDVSLLTHAEPSHWRWTQAAETAHLYLSPATLAGIASEIFDRDVEVVNLLDILKADDPVLSAMVRNLIAEVQEHGIGGRLYVEAITTQICVRILRKYANVVFRLPRSPGSLSRTQSSQLVEYIEQNLHRNISLSELAGVTRLSVFNFARQFRATFGCPPHVYVVRQRLEYARRLLTKGDVALKLVAAQAGFADQSHMTRVFRRMLGVTPGEFRHQVADRVRDGSHQSPGPATMRPSSPRSPGNAQQ